VKALILKMHHVVNAWAVNRNVLNSCSN